MNRIRGPRLSLDSNGPGARNCRSRLIRHVDLMFAESLLSLPIYAFFDIYIYVYRVDLLRTISAVCVRDPGKKRIEFGAQGFLDMDFHRLGGLE